MSTRRRWLGLAAVLVAVGGGGLGWQALRPTAPARPLAPTMNAAASVAATLAWRPAAASAAAPSASAAMRSAERGGGAEAAQESVEVCGVGRVTRQQVESGSAIELAGLKAKADALDRRRQAALSQVSARLAVGSDSQRVAARLLMDDAEGAALVAARSSDGAAHRLALLGCRRSNAAHAAPNCQGLTTQAWQQLDPQDARPWADLMVAAWRRKDEVAAAQALDEMLARRPQGSGSPLLDAVVGVRDAVADDEAMGLLVVEVIGRDAAWPREDPYAFSRYCSAERLKLPAYTQRCERLARWQLAHAVDLMDAMLATTLADRVGLPNAQRPFTRDQLKLGHERLADQSLKVLGLDCRSLRRTVDWAAQRVELGELRMALQAAGDR